MMSIKSLAIFAVCFLGGAAATIGIRAARHHPYAESTDAPSMAPTTAAPTTAAPAQSGRPERAAPPDGGHDGHDGHGAPPADTAPRPATPAQSPAAPPSAAPAPHLGSVPAPVGGPDAPIANSICPVCGMDVDPDLAPVATAHGVIGIACPPCIPKIKRDPKRYADAARENRKAP